jgi:hypothetical protein
MVANGNTGTSRYIGGLRRGGGEGEWRKGGGRGERECKGE